MAKTQKRDNVKIKKKKGYTQVQNWAPDDMTLSDKALGLYTRIQRWITFEAPGFECTKHFMRTKTPSGEKAFDSAWNELKDRGYLKMYCIPPANWEAELLDEPQPDTPHTYYLNSFGEVKSTNIDRAEKKKKALESASNRDSEYYPQKRGNTKSTNTKRANTKSSNTKSSNTKSNNTNGGKNINTSSNTSFNPFDKPMDNTNLSINHQEEDIPYGFLPQSMQNQLSDRVIDGELISEIKNQISYDLLTQDGFMQDGISEDDLNIAVEALAHLKTVKTPQEFSGNIYSAEYVRNRADSIKMDHIQYVFECFYEHREKVFNVKKYITTAIFNAPVTMGAYYSNAVRSKGLM